MAIRRLNYTGRKRIRKKDARITLHDDGGSARFGVNMDLGRYKLPGDALVFIEAYRQTTWMRFAYGTVERVRPSAKPILAEFDATEGVLFRVRITSSAGRKGLLLAEIDGIQPRHVDEIEDQRIPLLPVKPDLDLGHQVFRIDFSDRPLLLINGRAADWGSLAKDPVFAALVYPSALREILTRVLYREHPGDVEDLSDWRCQWLRFALSLPGMSADIPAEDADEEKKDDWIDGAVDSFCRRMRMMDRFGQYWAGEGAS